jgi:pimeloyl-ACP methyl ester carboxylesterase
VRLPHDEAGTGPAVLLIHAGVADRTMWSEHLEPLAAAGYRAVAVDLPGFGEATVEQGEQAPWADVLSTIDGLDIERAALVGSSFGGAVALRVSVVAPARVSKLVLISAPAPEREPSAELEAVWAEEEEALARGDIDGAVEAIVNAWTLPDAPEELRARVAEMQRRAFELQGNASDVSEAPDPVEDDPEAVRRLEVPTLVAVGEHDMIDFRDGAEALEAAIPDARRVVIEGAGHLAPLETPDAFRRLLLAFLGESA